ncbi:uncharacterized protein JN550_011273 [Neoarthrinium moseri]|uniref:uncharacterized protein n=1 Tax=Neoarthrinium moseri TaxID=1658444 RepID=UPI001FDB5B60|nr:uncharacterized protein JN550_011273 [Neoarthrinium moseri]KAI1860811.1 hypothetical protein JN550_011273 [Neoarthrinium moseri]
MAILLFCVAEEAKPFISKIMSVEQSENAWFFALAESREGPAENGIFKNKTREGATVETDFIGAPEQDCRVWGQEQMQRWNTIDKGLLAIADQRTARDETISLQFFNEDSDDLEFDGYGKLPAENQKWYNFRVKYADSFQIYAALTEGAIDVVYPTYFGRQQELTGEDGVFDVERAEKLCVE